MVDMLFFHFREYFPSAGRRLQWRINTRRAGSHKAEKEVGRFQTDMAVNHSKQSGLVLSSFPKWRPCQVISFLLLSPPPKTLSKPPRSPPHFVNKSAYSTWACKRAFIAHLNTLIKVIRANTEIKGSRRIIIIIIIRKKNQNDIIAPS